MDEIFFKEFIWFYMKSRMVLYEDLLSSKSTGFISPAFHSVC